MIRSMAARCLSYIWRTFTCATHSSLPDSPLRTTRPLSGEVSWYNLESLNAAHFRMVTEWSDPSSGLIQCRAVQKTLSKGFVPA